MWVQSRKLQRVEQRNNYCARQWVYIYSFCEFGSRQHAIVCAIKRIRSSNVQEEWVGICLWLASYAAHGRRIEWDRVIHNTYTFNTGEDWFTTNSMDGSQIVISLRCRNQNICEDKTLQLETNYIRPLLVFWWLSWYLKCVVWATFHADCMSQVLLSAGLLSFTQLVISPQPTISNSIDEKGFSYQQIKTVNNWWIWIGNNDTVALMAMRFKKIKERSTTFAPHFRFSAFEIMTIHAPFHHSYKDWLLAIQQNSTQRYRVRLRIKHRKGMFIVQLEKNDNHQIISVWWFD